MHKFRHPLRGAAVALLAMGLALPAAAQTVNSPATAGCSDGSREGYLDLAGFPNIAGCGGAWTIPGIANFAPAFAPACPSLAVNDTRTPACGRQAGDDSANPSGNDCNAEDLCAEGWHICLGVNDLKEATPTPTTGCNGAVPPGSGPLWFATRQATNGCGRCADGTSVAASCNSAACTSGCLNTQSTTNDVYGCGNIGAPGSCGGLGMTWTGNLCSSIASAGFTCNLPTSADNSGLCETYTLLHSKPKTGGVLCCKDETAPDTDGDGVPDTTDNCVGVYNPDQADADVDGFGDVCDSFTCIDDDGDDACNQGDNCLDVANPDQLDSDDDGAGDACDPCPFDPDDDADDDGLCADVDSCPNLPNVDPDAETGDVFWTDWHSTIVEDGILKYAGTVTVTRPDGQVVVIDVKFSGPKGVGFFQTGSGADYFTSGGQRNPATSPFTSDDVSTIPPAAEMIALRWKQINTLEFSEPVGNPLFSYISLNGNGYGFDQDFEILSFGHPIDGNSCGYWGCGTSFKQVQTVGGSTEYQLLGTGEPHGTLRFIGAFDVVNWRSLSDEYWNGFTVGITGLAQDVPTDTDGDCLPDNQDNCPDIPNPDQADSDNDGIGDVCDDACPDDPDKDEPGICGCGMSDACQVDGQCLGEGESVCADAGSTLTCAGGALVTASCGGDSCDDSGGASGGGTCTVVDHFCANGVCDTTETHMVDSCGGSDDSPSVQYWSCSSAGTGCVAGNTTMTDSCSDTGDDDGGGACSAIDWSCSGGALASSASGGSDTCGGTDASPSITTHACVAAAGTTADTCAATERTENDSCSDTGGPLGGGTCSASDWSCLGKSGFTVKQGDVTTKLEPLQKAGTVAQFYSYGSPAGSSANAGEETSDQANIYLYRDTNTDKLSLVLVYDVAKDGTGGAMKMTIDGLPAGTTVALKDDPNHAPDTYNTGTGKFTWAWGGCCTDGMALTFPTDSFCITINPTLVQGIDNWTVVSHGDGARTETDLGSLFEPIELCTGAVIKRVDTVATDSCTGDDDVNVTSYSCSGDNVCVASQASMADSCADSGTDFGGGSCSATNWFCAGNTAESSSNDAADSCGGSPDAPVVNLVGCGAVDGSAADTCVSDGTNSSVDTCIQDGGELGGGSCVAFDWRCEQASALPDHCKAAAYGGKHYAICQGQFNLAQAESECAAIGASVAYMDTEAENAAVVDAAVALNGCTHYETTSYWIANTKSDGSTSPWPSGTSVWASGEPNSGSDDNVHILRYCGQPYGWNDAAGTAWTWGYVCESDTSFGGTGTLVFDMSAETDTCGGSADQPSVEYWSCAASDGAVADSCSAHVSVRDDACSDTGGSYGGGACEATDWDCTAGTLQLTPSDGTDVCGGSVDAPSVEFFSCVESDGSVADRCQAGVTVESDSCVDTGNESGGGTCTASDWVCPDNVLSKTDSGGVDTCGDGSDDQTTYFVCGTNDGGAADRCDAVPDVTPPEVSVQLTPATTLDDGTVVYAVTCDAVDICDNDVDFEITALTPDPDGLNITLKNQSAIQIHFNLNAGKLTIKSPTPDDTLANLTELGGLSLSDGELVTVDTNCGNQFRYEYVTEGDLDYLAISGIWYNFLCTAQDDAGHTASAELSEEKECNGGGGSSCNQGVGNGDESCDPGNSNQGNPENTNDEESSDGKGTPGNPGKKGGKK